MLYAIYKICVSCSVSSPTDEEEDLRQMQMDFEDFTEIDNMPCD